MLANTLVFLWVALSYEYKAIEHKVAVIVPSIEDAAAQQAAPAAGGRDSLAAERAAGVLAGAPPGGAAAGAPPGLPRPRAAIAIARGRRRGYPPGARRPRRDAGEPEEEAAEGEGEGEEGQEEVYSRSLAWMPRSPALPAPFR